MLKASELRIGNWIADRGLKEWQIDHWETMNKVSAKPNTMMCGGILMETHPLTEYIDYLKPIHISEKWLLKFGYSIDESNSAGKVFLFIKEVGFVNDDLKIIYFSKTGKFMRRSLEIKSVHQLQNSYFALVGEELVLQD